MPLPALRQSGLCLLLLAASATCASAWWDRCNCGPYYYAPPPVYAYDHTRGPTWTGNGWSYPPVGIIYYPAPIPPPAVVAPAYRIDYGPAPVRPLPPGPLK